MKFLIDSNVLLAVRIIIPCCFSSSAAISAAVCSMVAYLMIDGAMVDYR